MIKIEKIIFSMFLTILSSCAQQNSCAEQKRENRVRAEIMEMEALTKEATSLQLTNKEDVSGIEDSSKSKVIAQEPEKDPMGLYLKHFSRPQLSYETLSDTRFGKIIYIDTDRFLAQSLYSSERIFDAYDEEIQKLYQVTFADLDVMQKYVSGEPYTPEEFVATVDLHSMRWEHDYPFAGFIILEKENNEVAGFQVLAESKCMLISKEISTLDHEASMACFNLNNTASMAICFNKQYHRNDVLQNVGYECAGALCLVYGQWLFENKKLVNQTYSKEEKKFVGGQPFTKLQVSTKDDNFSKRMPERAGCRYMGDVYRYGHNRHLFEKEYHLNPEGKEVVMEWRGKQAIDEVVTPPEEKVVRRDHGVNEATNKKKRRHSFSYFVSVQPSEHRGG